MDTPQPQPEGLPSPEETEEKLNVYELTPTKTEAEEILEKINPTETKTASGPAPVAQTPVPEDKPKEPEEESLLEKIETSLKIKKPAPKPVEEGEKKTPESVWVEKVQKVIQMFRRKPFTEQQKAQNLEEDYLEEHDIKVRDNGENK